MKVKKSATRIFNKPTIAALYTALRRNAAISAGGVIRPDDDLAAITIHRSVGLNGGLRTKIGNSGVLHIRVLALVVATDTNRATTLLT